MVCARLTLLLTLTRAISELEPSAKYTLMLPEPEPEAAMEVMYSMFSTPLMFTSRGASTVEAMVSADAPGYVTLTLTVGGTRSGYCAMGSARMASAPTRVMTMDMTAERMGLRKKKFGFVETAIFNLLLGRAFLRLLAP